MTEATGDEWACVLLIEYADGPPQGRRVVERGTEARCQMRAKQFGGRRDLAALAGPGSKLEGSIDVVEVPDEAEGRVPVAATIVVCPASALDEDDPPAPAEAQP